MYTLIWKNTIQSCMSDATGHSIQCCIDAPDNLQYTTTFEKLDHVGWKIIDQSKQESLPFDAMMKRKNHRNIDYDSIWNIYKVKHSKPHYTEAKLVKAIEQKGIGRPSTYATLVEKNKERQYISRETIEGKPIEVTKYILQSSDHEIKESKEIITVGKENNKLQITSLGKRVISFLYTHFDKLFNYEYTKEMENALDDIVKNKKEWYRVCDDVYKHMMTQVKIIPKPIKDTLCICIEGIDYEYKITAYGSTLYKREEKEYINLKKHITYEYLKEHESKLSLHEITLDRKIDDTMVIKKGKYGYYAEMNDGSRYSLKGNRKPIDKMTKKDVLQHIQQKQKGFVRELTKDMSVRNGKYGDYVYYKTEKMKKPMFLSLQKYDGNIREDNIEDIKDWIQETHFM